MRELVASLEKNKVGPSAPPVPPADQEALRTPKAPAPDVGPDQVLPVQSPIQSAIRSPARPEQGWPLADPLPDTLESLHGIPMPKGVEAFNPESINLDGSLEPPVGAAFVPIQGTSSRERAQTVIDAAPVATRSPSPTV